METDREKLLDTQGIWSCPEFSLIAQKRSYRRKNSCDNSFLYRSVMLLFVEQNSECASRADAGDQESFLLPDMRDDIGAWVGGQGAFYDLKLARVTEVIDVVHRDCAERSVGRMFRR